MRSILPFLSGNRQSSRGQSLVELALTLPIMTTILMGLVDVSFILYAHIQVAAAAGEGARAGSLFSGDYDLSVTANDNNRAQAIRQAIYNSGAGTSAMGMLKTSMPNFDVGSDVVITYQPDPPADDTNTPRSGDQVVVTVRYRQPLWFDLIPGQVLNSLEVSSTARMRIQ